MQLMTVTHFIGKERKTRAPMHPQLEAERFHSCAEFIEALDKCHQREFYKRMFGICNNEKDALTNCLHEASLTTKRNATIKSRDKRQVIEDRWRKVDEEEFGEDAILRIIAERQYAKRALERASGQDKPV